MDTASGRSDLPATLRGGRGLRLAAVAMMRNEGDIIRPFLRHCAEFFDEVFIADVRATDGTGEVLRSFHDPRLQLHVYEVTRQEKFQGALMNLLSRRAFARGADWVFLLDGDEFLAAETREDVEQALRDLGGDVMMLPWMNLVPMQFGSFASFDVGQDFRWSGRTSSFSKVAISSLFAANNPDYHVQEGNHAVAISPGGPDVYGQPGLPLLHLPVRSLDRLKYRIGSSLRLVRAKHNRKPGEGSHVDSLDELLGRGAIGAPELRFMAASYGQSVEHTDALDPEALGWPVRRLPAFCREPVPGEDAVGVAGLSETLRADAAIVWDRDEFARDSGVAALIDGNRIRIVPQALAGSGTPRNAPFAALPPATVPESFGEDWLTEVVAATCTPMKAWAFSAWTELVPVMYALFALLKPRRYAELGVHNGMSFFAACQIAEKLGVPAECVAVDSWVGDVHAGFHDTSVFDGFRAYIAENHPDQHYIQAYFSAARAWFEDGSIDLLHIDGLHTYEAVKEDFETWLPKMSDAGVIIFHDTNEFGRGFGVWRLWEELRRRYPAFEFAHEHGLGVVYVGKEPHPFAALLRQLSENRPNATLAQAYFAAVGTLLKEQRSAAAALSVSPTDGSPAPVKVVADADLQARYDAVVNSTTWRMTAPLRAMLNAMPALRHFLRRGLKSVYWLVTGQFPERYRLYRQARAEAAQRQGS
ncbi:class I SAM-dependent methyltransferase [Falsiroseomonas sp. HW251]|uniref:class I SAM-dependent methyltransferase n=1 Tax=Falsiroseomonas sp. HW251 TaxID=3390998 RepID=UPI003D321C5D